MPMMHARRIMQYELWVGLLLGLLLTAFPGVQTGRAQEPTPAPPTVTLSSPRFDAGRNAYLLDAIYTRADAIGHLVVSVSNEAGIEVARPDVFPAGRRNQTVTISAVPLNAGERYRIEVSGFGRDGSLLFSGQGNAVLAAREFTHAPQQGLPQLGVPDFTITPDPPRLTIDLTVSEQKAIGRFRVILKDADSNLVAREELVDGPPPLSLSLVGVPSGGYLVEIRALDHGGDSLTAVAGEIGYESPLAALGPPLFAYETDPPALEIRLAPGVGNEIARFLVSLEDQTSKGVILDYETEEPPPLLVPLEGVASGDYRVVVQAFDATGRLLAATEGETSFSAPAAPGPARKVQLGLRANPLIPLAIALVFLALVGFFLLRVFWARRATATPVLQSNAAIVDGLRELPFKQTAMLEGGRRPALPAPASGPPELALTVIASPDAKRVGQTMTVDHFPFTIGRGDCDLDLSGDNLISRIHAEIRHDRQGAYLVDRLSSNGTYLAGERIAAESRVGLDGRRPTRIRLGQETHLLLEPVQRR